jgi:hypothetical protein
MATKKKKSGRQPDGSFFLDEMADQPVYKRQAQNEKRKPRKPKK